MFGAEGPAQQMGRMGRPAYAMHGLRSNQVPGKNPNPAHGGGPRSMGAKLPVMGGPVMGVMPRPQMGGIPIHIGIPPASGGAAFVLPQMNIAAHQLAPQHAQRVQHILQMLGGQR